MDANTGQGSQNDNLNGGSKPAKKRNWKKIILFVVIGIAVFLVVITLTVNSATKAPVAVSNQFIDNVQASNGAAAYALLSTEAQQTVPADQFDALVTDIGPILNTSEKMTSKSVSGETGQAATAVVTYEIAGTDGSTYVLTINLTKENDNWKVLNFESKEKK